MEILIFVAVVAIFIMLNKDYNSQSFNHIKINTKQDLQGNLVDHEAGLLIALMAKVAKADGQVCELEAELLKHTFTDISMVFNDNETIREELKKIYAKEKETFENTMEICNKYYKLTKSSYDKRVQVMQYLLNLAFIDGEFTKTERMIIEDISDAIKIKRHDLDAMINEFMAYHSSKANNETLNIKKAYEVLEVSEDIDDKELKKQYRKLVKQNHPDIVTGKGADEQTIKQATIKLQEINEAYEAIKKHRGI
jgi:DnaJ like chaperone protein